jgi:hypothetical protein
MVSFRLLAVSALAVLETCHAQQAADCVERRSGPSTCYMAKHPEGPCSKSFLATDYYQDFNGEGGVFNRPEGEGGCLPWRFHLAGDNCRDNPNFNPVQHCNALNPEKPFSGYPRLSLDAQGRLGGDDRCATITCFPGDRVHTSEANGRSEMFLRPEAREGMMRWYAWSFRLPEGFRLDNRASCNHPSFDYTHCIIAQMHTTEKEKQICGSRGKPGIPFNLNLRQEHDELLLAVNFGSLCGDQRRARHGRLRVEAGKWYDVVLGIAWSADPEKSRMEIELFEEGAAAAVFSKTVTGVPGFFQDEGNGFLIFHLGAYVGKNFCHPVSVQVDEVSLAKEKCCLKSPRVACECR